MPDSDFKIEGLDNLTKVMAAVQNRFPEEKKKELLKLAYMLDREILLEVPVDTGRLRSSFSLALGSTDSKESPTGEGVEGKVLMTTDSIEVGTMVSYAQAINDGFVIDQRFVPGIWNGQKFKYDPNAKTGMMLHPQFVLGKHYMEKGFQAFESKAREELEKWIQNMLDAIDQNNEDLINTFKNL
jgi:hypothetical protein